MSKQIDIHFSSKFDPLPLKKNPPKIKKSQIKTKLQKVMLCFSVQLFVEGYFWRVGRYEKPEIC